MKDWLTIGQFSVKTGLTSKALRLYEEMNLLSSKSRGENGYRYYHFDQIEKAIRLKGFKDLGFTLAEIKNLLDADEKIGSKNLGSHSVENQNFYLKLYTEVGPHVNTIINADDRASVEFASQELVKKGRIFYFSKNKALEAQIKKIGGVVSDDEELEIFGFNLKSDVINLKLHKIMAFEDEIALLSSLAAVMTVGLEKTQLCTK